MCPALLCTVQHQGSPFTQTTNRGHSWRAWCSVLAECQFPSAGQDLLQGAYPVLFLLLLLFPLHVDTMLSASLPYSLFPLNHHFFGHMFSQWLLRNLFFSGGSDGNGVSGKKRNRATSAPSFLPAPMRTQPQNPSSSQCFPKSQCLWDTPKPKQTLPTYYPNVREPRATSGRQLQLAEKKHYSLMQDRILPRPWG